MTKKDMVSEICYETGIRRAIVEQVIDSFARYTINKVSAGRKVGIEGFGIFEPKKRAARTGRNPHTGEAVPIPERIAPVFKPGKLFKEAIERWND